MLVAQPQQSIALSIMPLGSYNYAIQIPDTIA